MSSIPNPCPFCIKAYEQFMRVEAVQPLPEGAEAPLAMNGQPQCHDCAAAGTLMRAGFSWEQSRVAVANDRQEQYRLPGAPMGLVGRRIVRPSAKGDLDKHYDWLRAVGLLEDDDAEREEAKGDSQSRRSTRRNAPAAVSAASASL